MDHRQDNQLPKKLRDALAHYEIPYEKGRWEEFAKKVGRRQRITALRWASIAAAVMLAFLLVPTNRMDTGNTTNGRHLEEAVGQKTPRLIAAPVVSAPSTKAHIAHEASAPAPQPSYAVQTPRHVPNRDLAATQTPLSAGLPTGQQEHANLPARPAQDSSRDQEALLATNRYPMEDGNATPTKKPWNFGFEVSTAITDRAYFGGGVTAIYAMSPRVSLQGGIGWQHLGINNRLEQAISESENKLLTGTENQVSGFDIPLSVSYHINEGLYAAVGVSSFVVLREDKNLVYHEKALRPVEFTDPLTGEPGKRYELVEYEARYPATDRDFMHPLGFIQFSAGKRISIGDNLSLTAEPYFKLPVGQANSRKGVPYGGLRLKVAF
ncbi:hypothetical protein [Parapedobacter tibetensis]|uniref:hypothetical protein n=1 Tax=Parapedobacter tibetensis TaxID=2972951 RepID=UPI00214D32A8|nr:hypothetical protein [Parapedobacter tibetensis]